MATDWLASKVNLKPKTKAGYESVLETVVLRAWGEVKLRDLDHAEIQQWVSWLAAHPEARTRKSTDTHRTGLSAARVIQAYQVVHQVLRYAVRSKLIAAIPPSISSSPVRTPSATLRSRPNRWRRWRTLPPTATRSCASWSTRLPTPAYLLLCHMGIGCPMARTQPDNSGPFRVIGVQ